MKRDEILRIINDHRAEITCFGVKSLALFGSSSRDDEREDSDVDFLVEFSEPVGLFELIDLQIFLENILGRKVDLGTPESLKPILREQVLKDAIYV